MAPYTNPNMVPGRYLDIVQTSLMFYLILLFQMSKRKCWDKETMLKAIKRVTEDKMSVKQVVRDLKVPRTTLRNYLKNLKQGNDVRPEELVNVPLGRKTILPPTLERELVEYCEHMERNFYGLHACDLRRMAFQLALRNNIVHPFKNSRGQTGKKWLHLFMRRHSNLSFRKPQLLSVARIQGFSRENVEKFFSILKPEMKKIQHNPTKIFNVDETGLTVVQHKNRKVIAVKGKRQVHRLSSAERGSLVTVVTCMSVCSTHVSVPAQKYET